MVSNTLSIFYYNTTDSKWYEARTHKGNSALYECNIEKNINNPSRANIKLLNPSKDPRTTTTSQSKGLLSDVFTEYTHLFIRDNSTGIILFRGRAYDVSESYDNSQGALINIVAYDALRELQEMDTLESLGKAALTSIDITTVHGTTASAFSPAVTLVGIGSATDGITSAAGVGAAYGMMNLAFNVSSASNIHAGMYIKIDDEYFHVQGKGPISGMTSDDNTLHTIRGIQIGSSPAPATHANGAAVTLVKTVPSATDRRRSDIIRHIISRSGALINTTSDSSLATKHEHSEHQLTAKEILAFPQSGSDGSGRYFDITTDKTNILQEIHDLALYDPWNNPDAPTHFGYDYYVDTNINTYISHGATTSYDPRNKTYAPAFNYFKRGSRPGIGVDSVAPPTLGDIRLGHKISNVATITAAITDAPSRGTSQSITVSDVHILASLASSYKEGTNDYRYRVDVNDNYSVTDGFLISLNQEELLVTAINSGNSTMTVLRGVNNTTIATHSNHSKLYVNSRVNAQPENFGLTLWYPSTEGSNNYSQVNAKFKNTFDRSMQASSVFDFEDMGFYTAVLARWTQNSTGQDDTKAEEKIGTFEKLQGKLGVTANKVHFVDNNDATIGKAVWDSDNPKNPDVDIIEQKERKERGVRTQFLYAGVRDTDGSEVIQLFPCAVIVHAATNSSPADTDDYSDSIIVSHVHEPDDTTIDHTNATTKTNLQKEHRVYHSENGFNSQEFAVFPTDADKPTGQSFIRLYGESVSGQTARPYFEIIPSTARARQRLSINKVGTLVVPKTNSSPRLIVNTIAQFLDTSSTERPVTAHTEMLRHPYVQINVEPDNVSKQSFGSNVILFTEDSSNNMAFMNKTTNSTTNNLLLFGAKLGAVLAELNGSGQVTRYSYLTDINWIATGNSTNDGYTLATYGNATDGTDTSDGAGMLVSAQLTSSVNNQQSTTTIPVTSGKGSKYNPNEIIKIGNEYMFITDISGDNLTVQRGYSLSSPETVDTGSIASHSSGANIRNYRKLAIFIPTEVGHTIRVKHNKLALDYDSLVQTIEYVYSQNRITTFIDSIGLANQVGMPSQTTSVNSVVDEDHAGSLHHFRDPANEQGSAGNDEEIAEDNTKKISTGTLVAYDQSHVAFVSAFKTQLAASLNNSANSIAVDDASVFKVGNAVMVDTEEMLITDINSNTLTIFRGESSESGYNGTTRASHNDNEYISKSTVTLVSKKGNIDIRISDPDINGGLNIAGTNSNDNYSLHQKHMVFFRRLYTSSGVEKFGGSLQLQAYPMHRLDKSEPEEDRFPLWNAGSTAGNVGGYRRPGDIEFGVAQYRSDAPKCYFQR